MGYRTRLGNTFSKETMYEMLRNEKYNGVYVFSRASSKIESGRRNNHRVGYDFLYLCVIVDLYARKVVGYGISEYIDAKLVIDTFQKAYEKRGRPKNLLFHSDQGTQYTCFEFRQMLRGLKVTQSFSAPGNPYDNAVVESFFASIKKEDFRLKFYKTEEEFQLAVDMYIEFYNNYRPHQKLNYMTPDQAESIYFKEKEA